MPCPECGNKSLLRSSYTLVHYLRLATNSRRRYCEKCRRFWLQKRPHYPSYFSWHHLIYLALIGVLFYYGLSAYEKYNRDKTNAVNRIQSQIASTAAGKREQMYGTSVKVDMSLEERDAIRKVLQ